MTQTYDEILQQIEELKIQAEQMRKADFSAAVAEAKIIIEKYKLTAEDLGLVKKSKKSAQQKASSVIKYRSDTNPDHTYGGKGPTPAWLKEKLLEGRTKEEFLI